MLIFEQFDDLPFGGWAPRPQQPLESDPRTRSIQSTLEYLDANPKALD
jgi:hypothetical protein